MEQRVFSRFFTLGNGFCHLVDITSICAIKNVYGTCMEKHWPCYDMAKYVGQAVREGKSAQETADI